MKNILLYIVMAVVAMSCAKQDELQPEPQKSGIAVKLALSGALQSAQTRVAVDDNYPMSADMLSAMIVQGNEMIISWAKFTDIPAIVYLPVGNYSLVVKTNGERKQINERPMYYGENPFTIAPDVVTSLTATAAIQSMAVSVTFADAISPLTAYKMTYFDLTKPNIALATVSEMQNQPTAKRLYIDTPFAFGVKIEGRLNGSKWSKNVIQYENLTFGTYLNITVK